MTRPTYKEQERHLHEEYIAGRVEPMKAQFCFCGNLFGERASGGDRYNSRWIYWPLNLYSMKQLCLMENALFNSFYAIHFRVIYNPDHPLYELALFNGMVAALEVLKEVHRSWGEDVDGVVEFERRGVMTSSYT